MTTSDSEPAELDKLTRVLQEFTLANPNKPSRAVSQSKLSLSPPKSKPAICVLSQPKLSASKISQSSSDASTSGSEVHTMTYVNPSPAALNAFAESYVSIDLLRGLLIALRDLNFSARPSREEASQLINELIGENIVAIDSRFPVNGVYVSVTGAPIARLLSRLTATLDYRDSDASTGTRSHYDDVKFQYTHAVDHLRSVVYKANTLQGRIYGIFTRNTFEQHYSLKWA